MDCFCWDRLTISMYPLRGLGIGLSPPRTSFDIVEALRCVKLPNVRECATVVLGTLREASRHRHLVDPTCDAGVA